MLAALWEESPMGAALARMTDDESGFTLAEFIVAATVLFVAAVALLSMLLASQLWSTRAQERENLVNFTAGYMERIRGLSYSEVGTGPSSDPTGSVTATTTVVGAYTIQVQPTIQWVDDPTVPGSRDYKLVSLAATASLSGTGESAVGHTLESIVSSIGVR